MDKIPYQSFEQQIDIIKGKNITVYEKDITIDRLKNHSYYSLINGYKPHFIVKGHPDYMRDGATFNHFYAFKVLEMDLSAILLKYLQVIEQGFRTRLAHIIAREYTTDDQKYLDEPCYVNTRRRKYKTLKYFRELRDDPSGNSYSYYFKEHKKTSIPPWILLQDADFFRIINLYSCLPHELRNEMRSEYISLSSCSKENVLFIDSMQLLREYRNIYAHSKRNFDEKINYSLDFRLSKLCKNSKMFDKDSFDSRRKGKGLNAVIPLIFAYLNDEFLFNRLNNELSKLFIDDGYIDENLEGKKIFNDLTIYDILDLPTDFLTRIEKSTPIPSV